MSDNLPWPKCLTEAETLAAMVSGMSISRLGDGEIGIALGGGNTTHKANEALASELREILRNPAPLCLPAIPTMEHKSPKYSNWVRHKKRYYDSGIFDPERIYGSAFVGQTQSAPWIDTDEHVRAFRSLWKDKHTVGVTPEGDVSLEKLLRRDTQDVTMIYCTKLEAYSRIDELEASCVSLTPSIVVICGGPMASVLANRLTRHGIQAIDLGRGLGVVLRHEFPA